MPGAPRPPPGFRPLLRLAPVCAASVPDLRRLNAALFPIAYHDGFYADALASGGYTRLGTAAAAARLPLSRLPSPASLRPGPLQRQPLTPGWPPAPAAYHEDACVGAIACRVEPQEDGAPGSRLYIMTLGVLAPYRRLGIATKLLEDFLELCLEDESIYEVYLHVQVNNEEALSFYRRAGFEIAETIHNYYRRIEPPHCHVVRRTLREPY
eukprot:SM000018S03732  [mRNA]  locus=s18:1073834:1074694:- [translate_table: standard]